MGDKIDNVQKQEGAMPGLAQVKNTRAKLQN